MERLGNIGHWRLNITDNHMMWSEGIYEIHGINFEDYTPSLDAVLDAYIPQDRNDVEEQLAEAIENKTNFSFEKRIKRPSGEIRHIITQGECETDAGGKVTALFGFIQDITPIKLQEELYELSALGSNAALWNWDIAEDTLRWAGNSANILGYPSNESLPKSTKDFYGDILHPDDGKVLKNALINHFTKLDNLSVEIRIKHSNGHYEWFLTRAQAKFNDFGKAISVYGSMSSIQELKETQEKLEESNADLTDFASVAAHDLKAPLRSVSGFLELLKIEYSDQLDEKAQDYIKTAVDGANDMTNMIEDLLEYASLKSNKLNLTTINLDTLVKLNIRQMKDTIKTTGANITLDTLPTLIGDEHKIKRLFINLIENAIKYRADRPLVIEIKHKETDNHHEFAIHDNGIGMPEDKIGTIFDMFTRLGHTQNISGTGIGLAICDRITELHQGQIWAESQMDKGSIFHFTLTKHLKLPPAEQSANNV